MIKEQIRDLEKCLGNVSYNLSKNAKKNLDGKRSIYFSKNITKGSILTRNNIKVVRPSYGLSPKYYKKILGMKVTKNIKFGDRVKLKFLKR